MNKGRYVFSQVLDFLPRFQFDRLVIKYRGDWHSKDLNCYNQLLHLLFGQLTGCDSVRDICLCLGALENILYHLGFRNTVNQSSLSRANEKRDCRIYEEFGALLIAMVRSLYSKEGVSEVANLYRHRWDIEVFFKWIKQNIVVKTLWGYSENAVKIHLWVAIIAYLLIARAKAACNSPYSITEVATLIRVSALERTPLRELITRPNPSVILNQSVKEPTLFDNL